MLAKISSSALIGLDAVPVTVEVDVASQGLPSFTIVGLPDKAVEESKERVRAAIKNSGGEFPPKRITVNLAPADLPKAGPIYDLPIALGILIASGQLTAISGKSLIIGELSLDGELKHVNGILSHALLAGKSGIRELYIPSEDVKEAGIVRGVTIYPVSTLNALFKHLNSIQVLVPAPPVTMSEIVTETEYESDMADIRGQEHVKRALVIAAAGGHNIFMQGAPGAGKTMLARTLPSILPDLIEEEILDVTRIYSVTGNLPHGHSIITARPFRSPHHTTSRIGLIGGGTHPIPGEISLAHRGVLFLDEFPEFPRNVLEAMRQPMEDGIVTIARAAGSVTYPAKFILVAAANPCPCGNYGSDSLRCTCSPHAVERYQKKISGPLLDRIDLHVWVPQVKTESLFGEPVSTPETSSRMKLRIQKARTLQHKRFYNHIVKTNSEMTTRMVKDFCRLTPEVKQLLETAVTKMKLSARASYRIIKVSRTIADLEEADEIKVTHVAEALQYRQRISH